MFEKNKPRYITRGIDAEIPFDVQLFMWQCVDRMPEPKDYLQVFRLSNMNGIQVIQHTAEQPKYDMTYILPMVTKAVNAKVYIIDDGDHATMLLACEY
ncbi:MAG: DUF960 domain-containing protein [Ruminococcus flavefaciens]|nr:DUF960 domain-containing protein [Ruminococcus flavefaciens]